MSAFTCLLLAACLQIESNDVKLPLARSQPQSPQSPREARKAQLVEDVGIPLASLPRSCFLRCVCVCQAKAGSPSAALMLQDSDDDFENVRFRACLCADHSVVTGALAA